MKKTRFFIATLLVVAAASVAVVSCKKENQDTLLNNTQSAKVFTPPVVDDMNAYLKEFKKRMQSSTRSDNESLSIEEAAWHLSSVANYDFCNANVECDDVRFDTLYSFVPVTEDFVLLNDLANTYEKISEDIDKFFQNLELENKHFRLIQCSISEQGNVTIYLITTFTFINRWHYFSDDDFCDLHFSNNIQYNANGRAVTVLTNLFNLYLGKNTDPQVGRIYYVITRPNIEFHYYDWLEDPDEYSPNFEHSRLFCSLNVYNWPIPRMQMCYYLDSYIGLAIENNIVSAPDIVNGYVYHSEFRDINGMTAEPCGNHVLVVNYGLGISGNDINY